MTPLIPALAGGLAVAGILGVAAGLHPTPIPPPGLAGRRSASRLAGRLHQVDRRTRILAGLGLAVGVIVSLVTGWLAAVILAPLAVAGLPLLLTAPPSTARIGTLEALEEWTRALAGVLTVGAGLEEALRATLRSTPERIRPEVGTLVARLRARMGTEQALRAFADDLNDPTGDLVASCLILAGRRRGPGLASVLESLAESVAADVAGRREIEADRGKPRTAARIVTMITVGVLAVLALTGSYVAPYGTPAGQVLLAALLSAYVALLVWMRRMARGEPLPRFLGATARQPIRR